MREEKRKWRMSTRQKTALSWLFIVLLSTIIVALCFVGDLVAHAARAWVYREVLGL